MSISHRLGPRVGKRVNARTKYGLTKEEEMDMQWKHDKFQQDSVHISTEMKFSILVENLHPSASVEDIKASFSQFGTIQSAQYKLMMDDQGAHVGSCVITFNRKEAVDEAIKEFDQKWTDGYLLKVSPVKSILGASKQSSSGRFGGRLYSDNINVANSYLPAKNRLSGMVQDAAVKAANSTRFETNISSRLGRPVSTKQTRSSAFKRMRSQVSQVDELDAQVLDDELRQLLKNELIPIFNMENIPEWLLGLLIYTSRSKNTLGSYGSDMMNIKYMMRSSSDRDWAIYLMLKLIMPSIMSMASFKFKSLGILLKFVYFVHHLLFLINGE